jgi:hypothetical protein
MSRRAGLTLCHLRRGRCAVANVIWFLAHRLNSSSNLLARR